jgi:hypothetical protein
MFVGFRVVCSRCVPREREMRRLFFVCIMHVAAMQLDICVLLIRSGSTFFSEGEGGFVLM